MSSIIDFINNHATASVISAAISAIGAIIAVFFYVRKWLRDRRDSEIIYKFLLTSKLATAHTFRSTEAISSHTNISEKRVADLCCQHPKIKRNTRQKQSWKLID